jgi:hypothetical protein
MVYIQIKEDGSDEVNYIHNFPFDPILGLGKSEAELRNWGYLVDSIPAQAPQPGQTSKLYYNPVSRQVEIVYSPAPKTDSEILREDVTSLQDAMNAIILML